MAEAPDSFPPDLDSARDLIVQLRAQLSSSRQENALLRHKLDVLCKKLFGRKSDKVDPRQLELAIEQLANEAGAPSDPAEMDSGEGPAPERPRRKPRRRSLPKSLPRERVVLDVPAADKVCACGAHKRQIGEAVSEKLDYVPAVLRVVETVRLRYACPKCHEGVTEAPAPPQAVEKGLATEGLLAHVAVSKYSDHLPLFRLERIFARHGIDLPRSTMCGWIADVADALAPIGDCLRRQVTAATYLQTDDTTVTILGPDGSSKGRLWTYLDPIGGQVVFDATPTHERAGPEAFLADFRGYLQADAYSGYDALYRSGRMVEVACWAHTRRRFVEAVETDGRAAIIVALVRELYGVEHEAAVLDVERRAALRREKSPPLLIRIDDARRALAADVLPKSPLGEALRYLNNQWHALGRFVEDGRLRIDNNGAESQLRVVALGRKNWLFAGSMEAARRAALLYSLVQSCKLARAEPWAYLRSVLIDVATTPHRDVDHLTPKGWIQRNPAASILAAANA